MVTDEWGLPTNCSCAGCLIIGAVVFIATGIGVGWLIWH